MKQSVTIKKVYTVLFFLLLVTLGISSVLLFVYRKCIVKATGGMESVYKSITTTFSKQYPFEEKNTAIENRNLITEFANKTNSYLTSLNPLSSPFQTIRKVLYGVNKDDIYFDGSTAFVKLSNGYLAGVHEYCPSEKAWDNILDFSSWLKDRNIPYVTLITPDKSDDSITVFPQNVPHGYSRMLHEYEAFLEENKIDYIEAKQGLLSEDVDFYSWFYKTDHHWNVHAAFVTAQNTAKILNEQFSIPTNTSILDESNFQLVVYPKSFLGSYGSKLGDKTLREDMEVLYPIIPTDFHIEIPGYGTDKTGSFDTTLIDQSLLNENNSSYSAFLYGDRPLIQIENNTCDNGTKILFIKYSFADSLCPYMANTVQYLDMIDPRTFDGSIRSYIKQTKPDAVILCMCLVTKYDEENLHLK